jgi:hypothetical protein
MRIENTFFLAALITLLIIRTGIYLSRYFMPEKHLMIGKYIFHHFWFGFLFIIAGFLIAGNLATLKGVVFGIGFGIIADELVFMFFGGGGFASYWALPSVAGAAFSLILLYALRLKLIGFIVK